MAESVWRIIQSLRRVNIYDCLLLLLHNNIVLQEVHAFHISDVVLVIVLGSRAHLLLRKEYLRVALRRVRRLVEVLRATALLLQVLRKFAVLYRFWRLQRLA